MDFKEMYVQVTDSWQNYAFILDSWQNYAFKKEAKDKQRSNL
jgi:hypothetical protein